MLKLLRPARQAYLASGSDSDAASEGEAAGAGAGGDEGVERYRQLLLSGAGGGAALAQQQRRGGKAWGGGDDAVSFNFICVSYKANAGLLAAAPHFPVEGMGRQQWLGALFE